MRYTYTKKILFLQKSYLMSILGFCLFIPKSGNLNLSIQVWS